MTDITVIIEVIVRVIVAALCVVVIPYIKTKYDADKLKTIRVWAAIAVAAAEQLYKSTEGEEKKAYVLKYLEEKGVKVDADELDGIIEASVLELHKALYGTEKSEKEE